MAVKTLSITFYSLSITVVLTPTMAFNSDRVKEDL